MQLFDTKSLGLKLFDVFVLSAFSALSLFAGHHVMRIWPIEHRTPAIAVITCGELCGVLKLRNRLSRANRLVKQNSHVCFCVVLGVDKEHGSQREKESREGFRGDAGMHMMINDAVLLFIFLLLLSVAGYR